MATKRGCRDPGEDGGSSPWARAERPRSGDGGDAACSRSGRARMSVICRLVSPDGFLAAEQSPAPAPSPHHFAISAISAFFFSFFFITLGLEFSNTKSLRALNTSPPRNCFSLLRSSWSSIENCTGRYSFRLKNSPSGPSWRSSDVQPI